MVLTLYLYWTQEETHISFNGNFIGLKTGHRNYLVWVKSVMCRELSFTKQMFSMAFCYVQQTVKYSKVMSFQTSWIIRHNCTPSYVDVGHVTLSVHQWGPSSMLDEVQGSVWTAYDLRKSCVRQIEKGKALYRHPVETCRPPPPPPGMITHGLCGYSGTTTSWHFCKNSLHWRHNDHDGVSNHQPHDCLLNRLFRRRSKKTSKLRVTGLCVGNSPVTRKMLPFDDVIMSCGWSALIPKVFEANMSILWRCGYCR